MNQDTFDTEWDLWCGLFVAGRRSKAAYFSQLRHLGDDEFKRASRACVQSSTSRTFPTVGELMSHVVRPSKAFEPEYPIAGASEEQLRVSYERLEPFYELAQYDADRSGNPSPSELATPLKKVVYRVLQRAIAINAEVIKREYHRIRGTGPESDRDTGSR